MPLLTSTGSCMHTVHICTLRHTHIHIKLCVSVCARAHTPTHVGLQLGSWLLLKKPKVLILDDSTSAVDTATDAKIRKAFAEEIPDTTKLIIAQRVASVMNADRIIVMDDGRVHGFGTHEELLRDNEIYREVYESQTNGGGDFDEQREKNF